MKKECRFTRKSGLIAIALGIVGCGGGDDGTQVEDPVPTTVEITPGSATLTFIDATQGFTAVVRDQNGKAIPNAAVSWSSSDEAVLTVSGSGPNVTVTAIGKGSATLTATSGQASGTAEVEVAQTPAKLDIVSGDGQEGLRGTTLQEPLVVRVEDQGGTTLVGEPVTFRPDAGHGSVGETTVETGADGTASTEWTLGVDYRRQSLVALVGDLVTRFDALARNDPPISDLEFTSVTLSRERPTVFETVDVTARIVNLGDGATPATFKLAVGVDGQRTETIDVDQLQPDASGSVEFTVGPFAVGNHTIDLMLDPDEELDEWFEDNNSASELVVALDQKVISPGESLEVSSSLPGSVQLFRLETDEASDEALNLELSGGEGDVDLFVHFGDRPDHPFRYQCGSLDTASTEACQMLPTRKGVYNVALYAWTVFGPTTLSVGVGGRPVEDYNIDLEFVEGGTQSQRDIITQAARRWESVIVKGAGDWDFSGNPSGPCGPGSSVAADIIDDLRIYVTIDSIDGAGGSDGNTVADSDGCFFRGYATNPLVVQEMLMGWVRLDEHDIGQLEELGVLGSVALHEIGRVIGFHPFIWDSRAYFHDPSLPASPEADTHFSGYLSVAAFNAAGGAGYEGARVPLENGAVIGSSDEYWRQSVLGDEIMTPFITGTAQPLSLITIELLADIGYGVDLSQADPFSLSLPGAAGTATPSGPVIDLSNDVARGPVALYDMKTGSVRVIHRPR